LRSPSPKNPLIRAPLVRRRRGIFETSSGFGHRAPDFGVLPSGSGSPAHCPFVDAVQSLALTLRSRTLAFVRTQLPVVRRLLAIICDSVPLIGGAISFVGDALAPVELSLTPRESRFAVIQLSTPIEFALSVSTLLTDHDLP
jgi:hypothetical protein